MSQDLPTIYDPRQTEPEMSALWEREKCFAADPSAAGDPFVIVIPPPNVTGALHMGHALNNTLQDILIRRARMMGRNTLWMPGTDHAGIATQSVVERQIRLNEGKTRHDLGREELVKRIWAWKEQYGGRILSQLRAMGCSCDWSRTAFTLDGPCSRAVRETFFRLFREGLIYRGKRLVNWDPALQTAVADDELEDKEIEGRFHYLRYPLAEPTDRGTAFVTVATTRPETMLGDTAVAMNPQDPRAAELVGRTVRLPLTDRAIPIIADEHVVRPDPASSDSKARMSTGFLKVTPAHDPHDYEIGRRHGLAMINILCDDGTLNANAPAAYRGMDRFAARKAVLAELDKLGLLEKVEPYPHTVPHSQRSGVPIEPYLSDQWFVRMDTLAESAMDAVRSKNADGDSAVRIHPDRYAKTYLEWLGQKRDWCISRQLWWGHRIPIWHFRGSEAEFQQIAAELSQQFPDRIAARWNAEAETPTGLLCALEDLPAELCARLKLSQDADVLDTWFSSALWPFSTLGWPAATPELARYYPGNVLVTSRDIITLWVARMVMMGRFNLAEKPFGGVPFRDVVIHAKIMDGFGETMSKMKGNGIDPVDIIARYGADGMRFTLASMATETQDIRLPVGYLSPHDAETIVPQERAHQKPDCKVIRCPKTGKDFAIPKPLSAPPEGLPLGVPVSSEFDYGRNFANKVWNASRLVMMNLAGFRSDGPMEPSRLRTEDRWVLREAANCAEAVSRSLDRFEFASAADAAYRFFWDSFCAWYLEAAKPRLREGGDGAERAADRAVAQRVSAFVLDVSLRLLHPMMPYVTERVWGLLAGIAPSRGLLTAAAHGEAGPLARAAWPSSAELPTAGDAGFARAWEGFRDLIELVRAIRDLKAKYKLPTSKKVDVVAKCPADMAAGLLRESLMIRTLAGVETLTAAADAARPASSAATVFGPGGVGEAFVPLAGLVDLTAERKRLSGERDKTAAALTGLDARLSNPGFVSKAKPEVLAAERARREELAGKLAVLDRNLAELGR